MNQENCYSLIYLDSAAQSALHWLYEAQTMYATLDPKHAQTWLDEAKKAANDAIAARNAVMEKLHEASLCPCPHGILFRPPRVN